MHAALIETGSRRTTTGTPPNRGAGAPPFIEAFTGTWSRSRAGRRGVRARRPSSRLGHAALHKIRRQTPKCVSLPGQRQTCDTCPICIRKELLTCDASSPMASTVPCPASMWTHESCCHPSSLLFSDLDRLFCHPCPMVLGCVTPRHHLMIMVSSVAGLGSETVPLLPPGDGGRYPLAGVATLS